MFNVVILGCDPGVKNLGVALYNKYTTKFINEYGLELLKDENLDNEGFYKKVYTKFNDYVCSILSNYNIETLSIEKPFFTTNTLAKNIRTLEVIGLIKLVANIYKIPVEEYGPRTIKKIVTGKGNADKQMVIDAVKLKYDSSLISTHIADASAVALTSYYSKL